MQTSGELRREIAKSCPRRMGRAKRNPSLRNAGVDGFRFALPILRNPLSRHCERSDLSAVALAKAEAIRRARDDAKGTE